MAIFCMKDIISYYNSVIKEFMDKGFIISPSTTNGGYLHVSGYTDLVNPKDKKTIIRVFLTHDNLPIRQTDHCFYCDVMRVVANKYEWNGTYTSKSLWLDYDNITLSTKSFYHIKQNTVYTDSEDELISIYELRKSRNQNKTENDSVKTFKLNQCSADFVDRIMCRVNSIRGFKRATASCITKIIAYRESPYYSNVPKYQGEITVSFNGRHAYIHLD